jgi:TRAP-type mannitol/chloroaromatic compound transport system permease small subunit
MDGQRNIGLRLFDRTVALTNAVATAWIILLMLLIVADVVFRNAFLAPIAGVPEMMKYSIVGIVFLQIAHAHASGQMIRSEGLLSVFEKRWPRGAVLLDVLAQMAGAAVTILLAIAVWPRLETAFQRAEFEGAAGHFTLPVWPFFAITIIGSVLLALSFLIAMARAWARLAARSRSTD